MEICLLQRETRLNEARLRRRNSLLGRFVVDNVVVCPSLHTGDLDPSDERGEITSRRVQLPNASAPQRSVKRKVRLRLNPLLFREMATVHSNRDNKKETQTGKKK